MEKVKEELKYNKKGITLISLVVTIVVLLILAGVSIAMLTGENGMLKQATRAKEETEKASIEEQRNLAKIEANLNTTESVYNGVKIPAGFAPTKITGETTVDEGLVVIDKNGNEYVWIEVPQTSAVYRTAGLDITDFTASEYTAIENDLHSYASEYRFNNMDYHDIYYSDETTGLTNTEYYELKHKMLKSIYQNGGFWIGRYEAGISQWRNEHTEITNDTSIIPLSRANSYPLLYVTCSEAQILAENVCKKLNLMDYTSSLMFGIQWDLILKYMETKGVSQEELNTDSTNWGNYSNSIFTLNNGQYILFNSDKSFSRWYNYTENLENYVLNCKKQEINLSQVGILTTLGSSNRNCKKNIYDFAGNVYEWTLEYSNNKNTPCVRRGGAATVNGTRWPANAIGHSTSDFAEVIGFRITIY